jgi:hypothetical protein
MSQIEEVHCGWLMFNCPYPECQVVILVHKSEVNCGIFRCHALLQPHASKAECDALKEQNCGCCQPFKINIAEMKVAVCEYI